MSDVSVIGLGVMGSALARTLLESGRTVTVCNRTGKTLLLFFKCLHSDLGIMKSHFGISQLCGRITEKKQ